MKPATTAKNYRYYTTHYPWSVLLLTSLVLIIHYLFIFWESYHFVPFTGLINPLTSWAISDTFNSSSSLMYLLGINYSSEMPTFYIQAQDGSIGYMTIIPSCTPIKAWLYWLFAILLFPGQWKHKVWYFPLGLIILYTINIIRISSLGLVLTYNPSSYNTFHSILETLLFGALFLLWALWVEKFAAGHAPIGLTFIKRSNQD